MASLITVAEARAAVLAEVAGPLPAEEVPLADSLGRVLAQGAAATEDVPGWDNSAMDGYAVRAADLEGASAEDPVRLRLAGESRAGTPADRPLAEGEAFGISTGGVMPDGADAVVRVEDTERAGEEVVVWVGPDRGADIRRAGEDIRAGDGVLEPGTVLGAAELGALASLGIGAPRCARRPTLAVVCTGDELLAPEEAMRPGGVRNSNALTVPALARLAGAEVVSVERCPDEAEATRAAAGRAAEADVAVFCGGVSVGEHDYVKEAFAGAGAEERFWGVALRPGKPTWFGVGARALFFGLPGNPVSAFVTFVLFVRPALRALQGATADLDTVPVRLAREVPRMERRDQAVRCSLELTTDGWLAEPTGPQGSHILTSLLGADALCVIEKGTEPANAGDVVRAELLRVPSVSG